MKILRKEFGIDYNTYSFGYIIHAIREKKDKLHEIYDKGFLPYSGENGIKNHLYMARSVRVVLQNFSLNSENRRIIKKFDDSFTREITPLKNFDINPKFLSFCNAYFKKRHNRDISSGKLKTVLEAEFITDIVTYRSNGDIVGYVFLARDEKMSHYWFSFYDLRLVKQSLGMWMMIQEILESKKSGHDYTYIGTGYGEKALYKMNFNAIEFWDGFEWIKDTKKLKELARKDKMEKNE